jgi:uncharacterized phage protein gp47/JayE
MATTKATKTATNINFILTTGASSFQREFIPGGCIITSEIYRAIQKSKSVRVPSREVFVYRELNIIHQFRIHWFVLGHIINFLLIRNVNKRIKDNEWNGNVRLVYEKENLF